MADHLNIIILECYIGNKPWILYSNGLKQVNRGKKGCCFNFPKWYTYEDPFRKPVSSNNETKYEVLTVDLETLLNLGAKHVLIRGDYELIINQLTHKFKCLKSNLLKYFSYASKLLARFKEVAFEHVFWEQNKEVIS